MSTIEILLLLEIAAVVLGAGVIVGTFRSHVKSDEVALESIDNRLGRIEGALMHAPAGGSE